jgi:glycosyltransferase involved in cell wall biosynthesis
MRPELSIVIPVRDEREVLPALHRRVASTLDALGVPSEVLFVDDGSTDATPRILARLRRRDDRVGILRLSRNFGHQAAVTAGLDHARGRAVVVMDGDLQDPPELIPRLVERWRAGYHVVYAVRRRRKEAWPLRVAYFTFYRLLRRIGELDIPTDSGDFCLLDRRAVLALRRLPERVRFVRGLRRYVGFRQTGVAYEREARAAGRPKYTLRSLCGLAADGLVSFSGRPLRVATYLGLAAALVAAGLTAWVLADALATRSAPRGWASTMVAVLFMGAVQLACLGIIGEYLRVMFLEAKRRPSYVVMSRRRARGQGATQLPLPLGLDAGGVPRDSPARSVRRSSSQRPPASRPSRARPR